MTDTPQSHGERVADFTLPQGCPGCGGSLAVRASAAGAYTCCTLCGWWAHPRLEMRPDGVELTFPTLADA